MQTRNVVDADYNKQLNVRIRHRKTLKWLVRFDGQFEGKTALDIGDKSALTGKMLDKLQLLSIENSLGDLDYTNGAPLNCYNTDVIFAFEVVEHLMNPLSFMISCRKTLRRQGVMFLSTSARRPNWLRGREHHFHEMNRNELDALIDKGRFLITDEIMFNTVPARWLLRGFRPWLRFLYFNRTLLLRLVPI